MQIFSKKWEIEWGLVADAVEESVEAGPVLEGEVDSFGGDIGDERVAIGFLGPGGVGDEVRDVVLGQVIEDVGATIHAAGLERAFLLREVVEMDALKGDVVEVKVALEAEEALHDLREVPTNDAAAGECLGKPA